MAAATKYYEAQDKLDASRNRQRELHEQLAYSELDIQRLQVEVSQYAAEAYKTGRVGVVGAMLSASSSDGFLARAVAIDKMTQRDQSRLHALVEARRSAAEAREGIDAAVKQQSKAVKDLAASKIAAERALSKMGGYAANGWVDPNSPLARPAKRNADGSWPSENCTIDDPTTGGCLTPRTNHALQEAQRLGFERYVSCWRAGNRYEHPKGRACDFAAESGGFANRSASGDNKLYGEKLASFFVKNGRNLAVMYVVWYCKIWHPSTGWRTYNSAGSNCGDNPAGDHTNHVHLSVY